ncbi:CHL1 [[Candida] subhashii]|uniref:ATP-dependent DNA helicase CHL1 n=1 Tax=[Candida] subhashii TaxID=561895 RepID=A0A8J5QNE6_9ASCO|nr:CHL1 [[Candida] subhashii]KAG7663761.1 CHL1 [[Candida] subhashii]
MSHPYTPYDIQIQLMDAIYDTIENGYKIGIFESPTGTGKTLSIICSSMTWLREYKRNNTFQETSNGKTGTQEESDEGEEEEEPEWVKTAYRESIVNRSKSKLKEYEQYLDKLENDFTSNVRREEKLKEKSFKRFKVDKSSDSQEEFLPDDYYSDSELNTIEDQNEKLSKEINKLMKRAESANDVNFLNECPIKIFYTSRTHSQLNQFSDQLRLTKFKASFDELEERTKYLPLGSRKQLCINDKVRALRIDQSMNDACIDLQKTKEGCEFLPKNYMNSGLTKEFADLSLAQIRDIEDLNYLGTSMKVCPYYSVRRGIELTEIISLPYQMLFQDSTRDILNLDIKDSIIIIDEAHNILDVITSLYSVKISIDQLTKVTKSLKLYRSKFLKKLNSGNRINLSKLVKICELLTKFIESCEKSNSIKSGEEVQIEDIFKNSTGDLLNARNLDQYLHKSKIAYKIESYLEKTENETRSSSNPLLFVIVKFLKSIANPSKEGKYFWDKSNGTTTLNYMLLDPSAAFKEIIDQAKCVLLCGGTMEPMSDYVDYLFPLVPVDKVKKFSCGHVIPKNNLEVFPVSQMNGTELEFSFEKRQDVKLISALGSLIVEACKRIPYGVVVFFPSYKYLNQALEIWEKSGIMRSIRSIKSVFQEPSDSSKVEQVLSQYSQIINNEKKGAILFSVVGGKMSEGINFSDNLARAVLMVGLPYPNAYSGEMIAKRKFIENSVLTKGGTRQEAMDKSRNYYENIYYNKPIKSLMPLMISL